MEGDPGFRAEVGVQDKDYGSLAFGGVNQALERMRSLVGSVLRGNSSKTELWGKDRAHTSELVGHKPPKRQKRPERWKNNHGSQEGTVFGGRYQEGTSKPALEVGGVFT